MATFGRLFSVARANNLAFAGNYMIEGQTLRGGDAFRSRVVLFPPHSLFPIRDVWSEADGSWSFTSLAAGTYGVLAIDKTAERNAATYWYVTAVPM